MTAPRSVRVEAVIERPPPLPWVCDLPVAEPAESWPGTLLSWRWLDKAAGLWVGIVRYRRDGLMYVHAVNGELVRVLPHARSVPGHHFATSGSDRFPIHGGLSRHSITA